MIFVIHFKIIQNFSNFSITRRVLRILLKRLKVPKIISRISQFLQGSSAIFLQNYFKVSLRFLQN